MMKNIGGPYFGRLADDVYTIIISYLSDPDVERFSRACKYFRKVINANGDIIFKKRLDNLIDNSLVKNLIGMGESQPKSSHTEQFISYIKRFFRSEKVSSGYNKNWDMYSGLRNKIDETIDLMETSDLVHLAQKMSALYCKNVNKVIYKKYYREKYDKITLSKNHRFWDYYRKSEAVPSGFETDKSVEKAAKAMVLIALAMISFTIYASKSVILIGNEQFHDYDITLSNNNFIGEVFIIFRKLFGEIITPKIDWLWYAGAYITFYFLQKPRWTFVDSILQKFRGVHANSNELAELRNFVKKMVNHAIDYQIIK